MCFNCDYSFVHRQETASLEGPMSGDSATIRGKFRNGPGWVIGLSCFNKGGKMSSWQTPICGSRQTKCTVIQTCCHGWWGQDITAWQQITQLGDMTPLGGFWGMQHSREKTGRLVRAKLVRLDQIISLAVSLLQVCCYQIPGNILRQGLRHG